MLNYKIEDYKNRLKTFTIDDEKDKYTFRVSEKYIFSSSIFLIAITFIAGNTLLKKFFYKQPVSNLKTGLAIALFVYVLAVIIVMINYKVIIQDRQIILRNMTIDMENIKKAVLKVDKVKGTKFDMFLEITTKNKRRIKCRLNISKILLFLKLIQNEIGERLEFQE